MLSIFRWFVLLLMLCSTMYASADVTTGINWLTAQFDAENGRYSAAQNLAYAYQATAETVQTLKLYNETVPDSALTYLTDPNTFPSTEHYARQLLLGYDNEIASLLLERLNDDGGVGDLAGYSSNTLDTAYVLDALAQPFILDNDAFITALLPLINYITNETQQDNGGWADNNNVSSTMVTAIAMRAIWHYRNAVSNRPTLNVDSSIAAAATYLSQQLETGVSNFEKALALIALIPHLPEIDATTSTHIDALRQAQQADGSWEGDVYTTALALRALQYADSPVTQNPDVGHITGRIVDGDTGFPLAGITISVIDTEQVVKTDANGYFTLSNLPFGLYTLNIGEASNFTAETQVKKAQTSDLGEILFFQAADTTVVQGTITDEDGNPVPNVIVSLTGNQDVLTDAEGVYLFSDVQAGDVVFEARKEGYFSKPNVLSVEAGQTIIYSPTLLRNVTTLFGTVYEADGTTPLAQATISVQEGAYSAVTAEDGTYQITDIVGGLIEVEATKTDYTTAAGSINVPEPANASIEFSPRLYPVNSSDPIEPPVNTAKIKGQIVDRNGYGLRYATVKIGDTEITADYYGNFLIENLPAGNATLHASKTYYFEQELPVQLAEHTTLDMGQVPLYYVYESVPVGVKGLVLDAVNKTILPNYVYVTVSLGDYEYRSSARYDTGEFNVYSTRFTALNGTIHIKSQGYKERLINIALPQKEVLDIGEILLQPEDNFALLPDLVIKEVARQTLDTDPETLEISGTVTAELFNLGKAATATDTEVLAFYDANLSGTYDANTDVLLGQARWDGGLAIDAAGSVDINISGVVPFRDAPVNVWVDSAQAVLESEEANNFRLTQDKCAENDNEVATVDLTICLDSSGSVSGSQFQMQLEGTASAIEDPTIVPHNGSVRLTVFQFSSSTKLEVSPTFITGVNASTLAEQIRNIHKVSGGTGMANCINEAVTSLTETVPATNRQILYVATDGYPNSYTGTQAAALNAEEQGVDVLNAMAVGSGAGYSFLESIVFPRPAGGDQGFVVGVANFEEYAQVIAEKFQADATSPDYSTAQLQLVKDTENDNYGLSVRVGNGGFARWETDMEVSFFAGVPGPETLLGTVPLVESANLGYQDVFLPLSEDLPQIHDIRAIVDWEGELPECDEDNNLMTVNLADLIGLIQVSTGESSYPPHTLADLYYTVANQGIFPPEYIPTADYQVELEILDLADGLVTRFPRIAIDELSANSSTPLADLDWDTGTTLAGFYVLRGTLYTPEGELVDTDESRFEITGGEGPFASLRTNTDKPVYHTTDAVNIDHLIQNLTLNKVITDGLLTYRIEGPEGQTVHTQTVALNELPPEGRLHPLTPYMLREASTGDYTVYASISDDAGELATDQTQFSVENVPALAVSGEVEVNWTSPQNPVCLETLSNIGTDSLTDISVRHLLINLDTQVTIDTLETQVSLAAETSEHWQIPPTSALETAHYACILQVMRADEWETLDFAEFSLDDFAAAECQYVYGVHDDEHEDSQLFKFHMETQAIHPLGLAYPEYDLEGLDINPYTHKLYASSGKAAGSRLYEVNAFNGDLQPIGDIGFNEVESLSFHPDGTLWGWADAGLIEIDLATGQGTLIYPAGDLPHMEGLAWDNQGNVLYATHSLGSRSYVYRYADDAFSQYCDDLMGGVESLEIHPTGSLIFASHLASDVSLHSLDINNCSMLADALINTMFDDIEGIAWPQNNCSEQQLALRAFFNAFADDVVFIGEDNQVRVELGGDIHLGLLAGTVTAGTAPADGQLQLVAIPDANADGRDDYLITYPDGQQQVLFYLGIDVQ